MLYKNIHDNIMSNKIAPEKIFFIRNKNKWMDKEIQKQKQRDKAYKKAKFTNNDNDWKT